MKNILSQATDREIPYLRCRRLLFRCWHRGTQESDLILDRSLRTCSRSWTATSSGGSRHCSIAPTPICLTGYSASVIRRQNMIMT